MSRYYEETSSWVAGLEASRSLTWRLLVPLTAVVGFAWPGDPEHLAYAALDRSPGACR